MTWLLLLTFTAPDGQVSILTAGMLVSRDMCIVAGGGSELVLEATNPGLDVTWTCVPKEPEAGV